MKDRQLPINWITIKLENIVQIQSGGTPSRSISSYWDGNIPWIKISDMRDRYIEKAEEYITEDGINNSSAKIFKKGTVLFSIFATIGKVGILDIDAATNQAIVGLVPYKGVDKVYLMYVLKNLSHQISEQGKGIAQKNINISILKKTLIPLPPLAEQKRIADKLDTLFGQLNTIQKAFERIPELIKNFRQQVLTFAVTGKLTEKWRKGKTLDKWENKSIGSLFKVQTGSTPHRENNAYYDFGKIPWIKSGEVKNTLIFNSNEYITELAIQETNAKIYPINTILIAMYGEGKTRGQVGLLKIPAASNQAVAALVNDKGYDIITIKYVFFFCLSQYNNIRNQAKGGNQPNLNLTTIKKWEIPLPPQKEQEEIVRIIDSIFKKLETIEQQYNVLKTKIEKLPQVLLNKAFSGELVDHLPSDGNAEDLLKEIEQLKRSTKKE